MQRLTYGYEKTLEWEGLAPGREDEDDWTIHK